MTEAERPLSFADTARCLADLGHPQRLQTFRLLAQAGEAGLSIGDSERHLGMPRSTLAHHIAQIVASGLVTQTREGRIQRRRVDRTARARCSRCSATAAKGSPDLADPPIATAGRRDAGGRSWP